MPRLSILTDADATVRVRVRDLTPGSLNTYLNLIPATGTRPTAASFSTLAANAMPPLIPLAEVPPGSGEFEVDIPASAFLVGHRYDFVYGMVINGLFVIALTERLWFDGSAFWDGSPPAVFSLTPTAAKPTLPIAVSAAVPTGSAKP